MQQQLPLPIVAPEACSFDNYAKGSNGLVVELLASLDQSADVRQVFLCGPPQSGKSHLLVALHGHYLAVGKKSFYVSLNDVMQSDGTPSESQAMQPSFDPALLESLDHYDLIAIDDVDQVAGQDDWETSLFNLINFVREGEGKIIFSASAAPSMERWKLADLLSRFTWGPVLKLVPLNEIEIRQAMLAAAQLRGMKLDTDAVDFLLKRYRRDASSLLSAIAILDAESLAAGRKRITIPFLKQCFDFG